MDASNTPATNPGLNVTDRESMESRRVETCGDASGLVDGQGFGAGQVGRSGEAAPSEGARPLQDAGREVRRAGEPEDVARFAETVVHCETGGQV
jgi:hypothetical protein